ncbi:peptidoglycan -binding protein [Acidisphaera sp. L21]|uniref:peptidoglycan -binding protein n=1 Tax=Acidisphaera sp. L21 TaxID=1641851 RepID=UPI00131A6B25|nr:peptidoglycan -binding protein [Acidisphaera sp. L21]
MSLRRRGGGHDALNPWPGYVDALSTLLMVIIFVLLVFVLAQAFLSVALSGKDRALDRLNRQMAELTDMLSLERGHGTELQASVAGLSSQLQAATGARDQLTAQVSTLQQQLDAASTQRDSLQAERSRLAAQLADAAAQGAAAATRNQQLQQQLATSATRTDAAGQDAAGLSAQLNDAKRQLAAAKAELDRTVSANKATVEARLADLARLSDQVRALTALRDELEAQARNAAAKTITDEQARAALANQLADEQKLSDSARAQIALMNRQVSELKAQVAQVAAALDLSEQADKAKDVQIANLGARLNTALASKVEELQRYRSDFFGRLRQVLANRPGVQIVGDRFVFQSEVLFPVGSADLTQAGQDQIRALATTVKQVADEIPKDLPWIMRVDGHADRQPVQRGGPFASNWELSSQRAINVVKLLIAEGVSSAHLAATGFAEYQPLDNSDGADANAKNRRIEFRLTDR